MQKISFNGKMPIIDTFRIAGVVGLLMQQTVAIPVIDASKSSSVPEYCSVAGGDAKKQSIDTIDDALQYLKDLTTNMRDVYRSLAKADRRDASVIISSLKNADVGLIEQQIKALDGTAKQVYQQVSDARKVDIKPIMITVAKARSAIQDLNQLISQMTVPVDVFISNIDREALKELAEHGTNVFYSTDIH